MSAIARKLASALLLTFASLQGFSQVSVFPTQPRQMETVRVQVPMGALTDQMGFPDSYSIDETQVSMSGNTITVSLLTLGNNGFQLQNSPPIDLPLGNFPAGTYTVEVVRRGQGLGSAGALGSTTFIVAPRVKGSPLWNFTDLWWNPAESGWGVNLVQHPSGIIFATWFVYGPDGKPIWYHIPEGTWTLPNEYRGPIYRTTGPYFGGAFDPSAVTRTLVGSAVIGFDEHDFNRAGFEFTIDGIKVTKTVQRLSF